MKHLHDYWNDPNLNESEKYLRDYILNKRYLDKDDDDYEDEEVNGQSHQIKKDTHKMASATSDDNDLKTKVDPVDVDLSEDEKIIENQEFFEKKYNFRFVQV